METSEVKHNHPLDTDPGGIWDNGKGRDREKVSLLLHTEVLGRPSTASLSHTENVSV